MTQGMFLFVKVVMKFSCVRDKPTTGYTVRDTAVCKNRPWYEMEARFLGNKTFLGYTEVSVGDTLLDLRHAASAQTSGYCGVPLPAMCVFSDVCVHIYWPNLSFQGINTPTSPRVDAGTDLYYQRSEVRVEARAEE